MCWQGYNKCQLVRNSSEWVVSRSKNVKINLENIDKIANKFHYKKFNQYQHHDVGQNHQTILKYLFVLDSCNFCFWPLQGFQYEQLATNIKNYITTDVSIEKLANITQEQLIKDMFNGINVPLAYQRARLVRQVSQTVINRFSSSFVKLVQSGSKSAVKLLDILASNFTNFQDHQIYEGHQIFFYKRAQILIAGIWGRYQGKGLGQFTDIDQITMFADYRVPQILNQYGILQYSKQLKQTILNKLEIASGAKQEIQIRAATIIAVEKIKKYIVEKKALQCFTLEVDHFLWQLGQSMLNHIVPHHRTLTIFY